MEYPPSVYKSSYPLIAGVGMSGSWPLDTPFPLPWLVAGTQNKANFLFHPPGLFIGF